MFPPPRTPQSFILETSSPTVWSVFKLNVFYFLQGYPPQLQVLILRLSTKKGSYRHPKKDAKKAFSLLFG